MNINKRINSDELSNNLYFYIILCDQYLHEQLHKNVILLIEELSILNEIGRILFLFLKSFISYLTVFVEIIKVREKQIEIF